MSWINDIVGNAGTTIPAVHNRLNEAVAGISDHPVFGPLVPTLPFPVLGPQDLYQSLAELATAFVAMGGEPLLASLVAGYLQSLEVQAAGRLKPLPDVLRQLLQDHYGEIDLSRIYYAEDIGTAPGGGTSAVTVDRHIYFPRRVNFLEDTPESYVDLKWLLHELQHCVQYEVMGGHSQFLLRFVGQAGASSIPSLLENLSHHAMNGTWDPHYFHDRIGSEKEAIDKAALLIDQIWEILRRGEGQTIKHSWLVPILALLSD